MFFWNSLAFFMIQQMLTIWSLVPLFMVHVLMKPGLENLSIYLLACEMRAIVRQFEYSLTLPFFGIGMKTDLFQSCGHCWVFQISWHTGRTLTASSFRIWNSSPGIPSPPLAFLVVMLPKAHLTHMPGCLALGEWPHHRDYLGREYLFCTVFCTKVFCVLLPSLFNIFCFC